MLNNVFHRRIIVLRTWLNKVSIETKSYGSQDIVSLGYYLLLCRSRETAKFDDDIFSIWWKEHGVF